VNKEPEIITARGEPAKEVLIDENESVSPASDRATHEPEA
jgi:hypothetical protein